MKYDNYVDFRYAATFTDNKYHNKINFVEDVMGYMGSHSMDDYFHTIQEDLKAAYENLDWEAIDRFVEDLVRYEKVAAFGLMFSETAAVDLQVKLGYNGKFIVTNMNDSKQIEYLRNADEDTLRKKTPNKRNKKGMLQ